MRKRQTPHHTMSDSEIVNQGLHHIETLFKIEPAYFEKVLHQLILKYQVEEEDVLDDHLLFAMQYCLTNVANFLIKRFNLKLVDDFETDILDWVITGSRAHPEKRLPMLLSVFSAFDCDFIRNQELVDRALFCACFKNDFHTFFSIVNMIDYRIDHHKFFVYLLGNDIGILDEQSLNKYKMGLDYFIDRFQIKYHDVNDLFEFYTAHVVILNFLIKKFEITVSDLIIFMGTVPTDPLFRRDKDKDRLINTMINDQ